MRVNGAAKICVCARRKSRQARLAIVPPQFNSPRLYRLKPDPRRHPNQIKAVAALQAKPEASYLLLGKNYTGKSHLAWALYRHAVYQERATVACLLWELLADFRRAEVPIEGETMQTPRVTSLMLKRAKRPCFLLFQEFEKATPSEFSSRMLFDLLDTARDYGHQIVITSNLKTKDLTAHWSRVDKVYGESIMTRLQGCIEINFF